MGYSKAEPFATTICFCNLSGIHSSSSSSSAIPLSASFSGSDFPRFRSHPRCRAVLQLAGANLEFHAQRLNRAFIRSIDDDDHFDIRISPGSKPITHGSA